MDPQPQPQPIAGPGVPGWLQPVVQVTTTLGVPTVFAGILLWFVLTRVGGTLDQMRKNDEDRMRMLAAMQDTLIATLNRQTETYEKALAVQTDKFVAAVNANIATNQGIAAQMDRFLRSRRGEKEQE
jgi:hypothetical protein